MGEMKDETKTREWRGSKLSDAVSKQRRKDWKRGRGQKGGEVGELEGKVEALRKRLKELGIQ